MSKISAIILTRNSEDLIANCIDSVSFCDEVIIIDDNSTDHTVELVNLLGVKVFNFSSDSFAERRNFGLKKSKYKWVLYIDDDERVTKDLAENIKEIISSVRNDFVAFRLKRKNFYYGNYEWPFVEKMERLFNRKFLKEWAGKLHETAIINGRVGEVDGFIEHYTHQDLSKMVDKTARWSVSEAELRYKNNHPKMTSWRFFRVMVTAFYNSYIKQKGYKAGAAGVVESIYQSFSMFITYAKLWELQNKKT